MVLIEKHRRELLTALGILLSQLAAGWARQRGDIFGFANTDKCCTRITDFDKDKLLRAPVSNLAAERSVGSIIL